MVYTSFADTTLQINVFTQQVLTQDFIWSQSHTRVSYRIFSRGGNVCVWEVD